MSEEIQKMEQDFSDVVSTKLPEAEDRILKGKLKDTLEDLLSLEKQTRTAADLSSTSRLLVFMINMCFRMQEWKVLNEYLVLLSKRRGQLKQAITKMVQEAISYIDKMPDDLTRISLIDTLRQITEGKIYVEVERARLTRMLSKRKEEEGDISKAAEILQELQVETFGSMDKREKVDFILEQMRLCIAKNDFIRTQIISKKISSRFFEDAANDDLKLRYCQLMIKYSLHEGDYLNVCKYYLQIYRTQLIQSDVAKRNDTLTSVVIYAVMSPHNPEQHDLLLKIHLDSNLDELPILKSFITLFVTDELMRWPRVEELFKRELLSTTAFRDCDQSVAQARWEALHSRVIEHNIRVVAKYYTCIKMSRLTSLLDLPERESEIYLSKLVVDGIIYARINRPARVVSFRQNKSVNENLVSWNGCILTSLGIVERTTHMIAREEMVNRITTNII